ncbi:MAG TPA: hypothetical protein VFN02_00485 [Ktedonobacteraceae bacterium]|nr:hypothetical protein [Ktedonobacteraceae bacterium]
MAGELLTTSDAEGPSRPPREAQQASWRGWLRQAMQVARQFLWGFFFFEMFHELQKEKARYSDAVNLIIVGELLGLPLMNSVIALRLLPYLLPELDGWKHRQLSEVDIIEEVPEIH